MKSYLFLTAGATLALASCSQTKTTDTTTTAGAAGDSTAIKTTTTSNATLYTDAAYKSRSQRIADKYAADMKVTDPAMREKIRTAYYNRSKRYGELRTKYATDTAGTAAATREANLATDAEFKTLYTDPAQYQSYESSRSTYDENNYISDDASGASSSAMATDSSTATSTGNATSSSAMSGSTSDNAMSASPDAGSGTVSKSKTKLTDGTKIKVKPDGQLKVKTNDGSKMKQ